MARFGKYETVKEISNAVPGSGSVWTTLYLAREADTQGPAQFTIKVVRSAELPEDEPAGAPAPGELTPDYQVDFLQAVKAQRKAAEQGAGNVAAVHEFGSDELGAWSVGDYYPRGALRKLILGQYSATPADLYHLVASVAQGLADLKKQAGRTHGNLKTANILIDGKPGRRLAQTRIVLTDLDWGSHREAARLELSDLRALGEIIFQVVRRREVRVQDNWPVGDGAEWKFLGHHATGWRELCNQLCDPSLAAGAYTVEELQQAVARFKPRLPLPAIGGVAVLALLVVAGASGYLWRHSSTGSLELTTQPRGARVLVGAEAIATTPYSLRTKPGAVTYQLQLEGYYETNIQLNVQARQTIRQSVSLVPWQGELLVTSSPDGAKVEAGDATRVTPFTIQVPVGIVGSRELQLTAQFGDMPRQTKAVVVEKDQQSKVEFVFARGGIHLESVPSGATVWRDGKELGRTPYDNANLAPGPVTYELRLPRYNLDIARIVVVASQQTRVVRELQQGSGTVVVRSDPAGAEVLQLGVVLGRTPFAARLNLGRQELTVRYPGLGETVVTVNVPHDETITNAVIRFASGQVQLASVPSEAQVLLDGTAVGTTPYTSPRLRPGVPVTYALAKGALSETVTLQVSDGQLLQTNVTLSSGGGTLLVSSDPPDAEIIWRRKSGDQRLGRTGASPFRSGLIEKGPQTLVARHPVLGDQEFSVLVKADQELPVTVRLAYGSVRVRTEPAQVGAEVFQAERKLGPAPWFVAQVKPGPVKYQVQAEDYITQIVEGDVVAGRTNELVAVLELGEGKVALTSDPAGAEAFVDGQSIGRLPTTRSVSAGSHELRVRYEQLEPQVKQVRIRKGETQAVATFKFATLSKSRTASIGLEMVWVPGLPGAGAGAWAGKYEVTQDEYRKVMGANPSTFQNDRQPVETVTIEDATLFCTKLTQLEKSNPQFPSGWVYALPSDEQWKYLAKGARVERLLVSPDGSIDRSSPREVGSTKVANDFGLCDMRGNVWELVAGGITRGGPSERGLPAAYLNAMRSLQNDRTAISTHTGFRVVLVPRR